MASDVGPFRTEAGLQRALAQIARATASLGVAPPPSLGRFDTTRLDWFDLRNMLLVADVVTQAALARTESRGAHQREDFPAMEDDWAVNQIVGLEHGRPVLARVPVAALASEAAQ